MSRRGSDTRSSGPRLPSFFVVTNPPVELVDDDDIPGIDRLLALTDGVVAIALTLLVLQLQVPAKNMLDGPPSSASALWHALDIDVDELTSYLVSFVVIAQFWLVHHRVLRGMRGHSEGLAWRNFSFLLALTLMPFTSDLLGRYGDNPVAITLFGINLVAISLSTQWIFHYAASNDLLIDRRRSAHDELAGRVRGLFTVLIVCLSVLLAWVDTGLARYAWLLFIALPGTAERITRVLERSQEEHTAGAARR
jgi:TMEM175 potassium channel family protein